MSVIVEERHPLLRLGVGWGGLACLRRGWGLNVYPGVGLQDEMPHGPRFVTIAFPAVIRWHQEQCRRGDPEGESPPKLMSAD